MFRAALPGGQHTEPLICSGDRRSWEGHLAEQQCFPSVTRAGAQRGPGGGGSSPFRCPEVLRGVREWAERQGPGRRRGREQCPGLSGALLPGPAEVHPEGRLCPSLSHPKQSQGRLSCETRAPGQPPGAAAPRQRCVCIHATPPPNTQWLAVLGSNPDRHRQVPRPWLQ